MSVVLSSLEQGLAFGIMVLGVFLSFRVLGVADLTVEGSFPLGGAVTASLIMAGVNPWLATAVALLAGAVAGYITGTLATRMRVAPLLAGILTMTALYSINLRVMGRSNIPLLSVETILTWAERLSGPVVLAILGGIVVATILLLSWFLRTSLGASLRATGDNEAMVRSLGIDGDSLKRLGLALSNALVALAGALVAQHQGFADIGMGVGTVVCGLASVIIGEVLFGSSSVDRALVAVTAGSIIYRLLTFGALRLGFAPTDLKLMTAILVVLAVSTTRLKRIVRLAWSS